MRLNLCKHDFDQATDKCNRCGKTWPEADAEYQKVMAEVESVKKTITRDMKRKRQ